MRGVPMVSSEDSAWDVPPSIFGTRAGGPTVQRLVLGNQMHRLRESRGITAEQAAAAVIRTYQIQLVPGLLQTEAYARALIRQGSAGSEEEIARRGELRASR